MGGEIAEPDDQARIHEVDLLREEGTASFDFVRPWIAWSLYVAVALLWFVPDRRIERVLMREEAAGG